MGMISVSETTLRDIEAMRGEHLHSLLQVQDLYLEQQIPDAKFLEISLDGTRIGYAIMNEAVMLELHLTDRYQSDLCMHLPAIVKACRGETILVQSFDEGLMACCSRLYPCQVAGLLYRDRIKNRIPQKPGVSYRPAGPDDLAFLLMQEDEVFEPRGLIPSAVSEGGIILCIKDGTCVGCGFITRIHPLREFRDVGVWVAPAYRNQGYGTGILSQAIEICDENRWIPICGCGVDNHGSQKVLEKNGFISHHRLIACDVKS